MSLEIKGQSCPICHAYLFEDDDVAVCAVCGAPHHRECFVNAGKCGMEAFHGTENQYDLVKKRIAEENKKEEAKTQEAPKMLVECPMCHNRYDIHEKECPSCNTPNKYSRTVVMGMDFYGGVDKNEDLGEGHTAEEVRKFVGASTNRTLPKFLAQKNGAKIGFSLWGLFFPTAKFASRKMYKEAMITGAFEIAATLFLIPLSLIIEQMGYENSMELAQAVYNRVPDVMMPFNLAVIGSFIYGVVKLLCGLFANKLYYKHVIRTMSEIRTLNLSEEEKYALYRKKGGLSILGLFIGFAAVQYLPSVIASFIL
ncbi:MAG: RING finger protein [Acutalibacteraceae bacterium]|nr:RING finger protein [Acutalibacteraceae bacterium]